MNVLSLFDGISCGRVALERAGINVANYYAAEIDKYAIRISEENYPDIIRLGDVTKWEGWGVDWRSIDLVLAGFPCQAWSLAGKQLGDKDPRGALFWTTLDIIKNVLGRNPNAKFLMENVKMKKEFEDYITTHTEQALGYVEKTLINSALVSAQNRNRFYWTNFKVTQPEDRGILLKDVVEDEFNKCGAIRGRYIVDRKGKDCEMPTTGLTEQRLELRKDEKTNTLTTVQKDNVLVYLLCGPLEKSTKGSHVESNILVNQSATKQGKAYTLTASYNGAVAWNSIERKQRTMLPVKETSEKHPNVYNGVLYRKLTPLECERLQTLPDGYTAHVSNTQRYKAIGNGWTVDVIAHILKGLK